MDTRKVELFLIQVFRPTIFGDGLHLPKPTESLGEYHVRMAKTLFGMTILVYMIGFVSIWFDSSEDFVAFNITDNVNMTFLISALIIIPLALPISLVVARLRVSMIKTS